MKKENLVKKLTLLLAMSTMLSLTTGCGTIEQTYGDNSYGWRNIKLADGYYVVVNNELHKGSIDAVSYEHKAVYGHKIETDCGQKIVCHGDFHAYKTKPNENTYDYVCEECVK